MAVGTDGKVVGAVIYNVGFCTYIVICAKGFLRNIDRDGFAFTRGNFTGFGKSAELYGRFFHQVFPVIIGVGRLHIDFHDILAGNGAVVMNGD